MLGAIALIRGRSLLTMPKTAACTKAYVEMLTKVMNDFLDLARTINVRRCSWSALNGTAVSNVSLCKFAGLVGGWVQ